MNLEWKVEEILHFFWKGTPTYSLLTLLTTTASGVAVVALTQVSVDIIIGLSGHHTMIDGASQHKYRCGDSYRIPQRQTTRWTSAWASLRKRLTLLNQIRWIDQPLTWQQFHCFSQPEGLEAVLRKMRYCLHENHYLITGKTSESVH